MNKSIIYSDVVGVMYFSGFKCVSLKLTTGRCTFQSGPRGPRPVFTDLYLQGSSSGLQSWGEARKTRMNNMDEVTQKVRDLVAAIVSMWILFELFNLWLHLASVRDINIDYIHLLPGFCIQTMYLKQKHRAQLDTGTNSAGSPHTTERRTQYSWLKCFLKPIRYKYKYTWMIHFSGNQWSPFLQFRLLSFFRDHTHLYRSQVIMGAYNQGLAFIEQFLIRGQVAVGNVSLNSQQQREQIINKKHLYKV